MFTFTTKSDKQKLSLLLTCLRLICLFVGLYLLAKPLIVYKQIDESLKSADTTLSVFKEKALTKQDNLSTETDELLTNLEIEGYPELKRVVNANIEGQVVTDNGSGGIIGKIVIPDVNIALPIYQGVGGKNMLQGAGTHKVYQTMGQGNYVLASHYTYSHQLFTDLINVELGDLIYVSDYVNIYVYTVKDMKSVNPNQDDSKSLLADQEGKQLITLYTCSTDGKMRTVVVGELLGYVEFSKASESYIKLF